MRPAPLLLGVLCGFLLGVSGASGGSYAPPPGDSYPRWSPDGEHVAFLSGRGGTALKSVSRLGAGEMRLMDVLGVNGYPDSASVALSPDWQWVATERLTSGSFRLVAVRLDGTVVRDLAPVSYGATPAWSPDSRRIAFRRADGTLAAIGLDGSDEITLAPGGTSLAWSPDGTRIAYAGGAPGALDIHVAGVDGLHDIVAAGGPFQQLAPAWSPDGTKLAFLTEVAIREPSSLAVVDADGTDLRTYGATRAAGTPVWTPDGRRIVYAGVGEPGLFRLDLDSGRARQLVAFGTAPAVSPDGTRLAFAGGGACRDRDGIYVARVDGSAVRRLTNDCRIVGTGHPDVIRGSVLADILVGLGGDDRLIARDPGYVGDTLLGGNGDDVLLGAVRGDILRGGRGDDVLRGGNSQDVVEGGPGDDRLDGGRGLDRIYARDRQRDVIVCGTNMNRSALERDEVWADRSDVVSPDCEVVHRSR